MLFLMQTFSSNEFDKEEYDWAVFKLEIDAARVLFNYAATFKFVKLSQPELVETAYLNKDIVCEFYPEEIFLTGLTRTDGATQQPIPESTVEGLDSVGFGVFPKDFVPTFCPKDAHEPDIVHLKVYEGGFYWEALPYNCSTKITTEVIPWEELSKVL